MNRSLDSYTTQFAVTLVMCAVVSCEPGQGKAEQKSARTGTQQMADTLAVINAQNTANPEANIFLNRERADELQALITTLRGSEALNRRHWMAEERLKAGQTREAIAELEKLLTDAGVSRDTITPQLKPVFDLLAIAYLRLGEQENCLTNPAANVCILPLKGAAQHTRQEGARGAIARYTQLLQQYPDDRSSQWLLNIAYLAIGGYPDSVPRRYVVPNLRPRSNDVFPLFPNIANEVGLAVTGLAGGLSVQDFNRDGHLDVFATSWEITQPSRLFIADGRGGYVDQSAKSGLDGIVGGLNTVDADYDNDGDIDILVLRGAWLGESGKYPKSLLRNRGDGTFEDATFAARLLSFHPSQTAAWADFNLDGWIDLFIGNESYASSLGGQSHRSELWLNNRDGTFSEVAAKVGINLDDFVKGVVWGDVNNDGLPDLFASVLYGRNKLFMNRGGASMDTWRFEDVSAAAGIEHPTTSFPTWFWDFDNDGWEDLLVLSYDVNSPLAEMVAREYLALPREIVQQGKKIGVEPSRLYKNNRNGTFTDVTQRAGLANKVIYAMGSNFGDLDNDGWLDFYIGTGNPDLRSVIPNRMFRSVGGQRFEEVTLPGGFGHIQKGHGAAFADFDRDGDQDIYMVLGGAYQGDRATSVLFENPGWTAHKWIQLEFEGRSANRAAIGARVEVDVLDETGTARTVRRTVNTGGSFGSASVQLHVGLGRAERINEVRVQWPDQARSRASYRDLALNGVYHIRQGDRPVALQRPVIPFAKQPLGGPAHKHN